MQKYYVAKCIRRRWDVPISVNCGFTNGATELGAAVASTDSSKTSMHALEQSMPYCIKSDVGPSLYHGGACCRTGDGSECRDEPGGGLRGFATGDNREGPGREGGVSEETARSLNQRGRGGGITSL
jgi:hypothetical protein